MRTILAASILLSLSGIPAFAQTGPEKSASHEANLAAQVRELEETIAEQTLTIRKLTSKVFITQKTREIGYADYYKAVVSKLETEARAQFPAKDGKRLYGNLIVTIPIARDGTLLSGEQAPTIEKSSGNADLDAAILDFIKRCAPFPQLPKKLLSDGYYDVWTVLVSMTLSQGAIGKESSAEHLNGDATP